MYDGNPGRSILVRVGEGSSYLESTVLSFSIANTSIENRTKFQISTRNCMCPVHQ